MKTSMINLSQKLGRKNILAHDLIMGNDEIYHIFNGLSIFSNIDIGLLFFEIATTIQINLYINCPWLRMNSNMHNVFIHFILLIFYSQEFVI